MASSFGTSPWHFYLTKMITFPGVIIGVCFVLSIIVLLVKRPKNIFLWCFIPFLLAHTLVPHKEERFMFSFAFFFAIILTTAYNLLYDFIQKRTLTKILNYVFLIIFAAVNIIGLLIMSQQGMEKGRIAITKYVYDHYRERPINVLFFVNSNPYNPWHFSASIRFYDPGNIQSQRYILNLEHLNEYLPAEGVDHLLFIKKPDLQDSDLVQSIEEMGYVFKKQSVPAWVEKSYKIHDNFPNMWIYTLFVYEGKQ